MSSAYAALAGAYVGRTVELAPHLDTWQQGDRFGTVTRVTGQGFTLVMVRSGRTIRAVTDAMIARYLD